MFNKLLLSLISKLIYYFFSISYCHFIIIVFAEEIYDSCHVYKEDKERKTKTILERSKRKRQFELFDESEVWEKK